MNKLLSYCLLLAFAASISFTALAQDQPSAPPPTDENQRLAEQHSQKGIELLQAGRFDLAVNEFKDSLRLKPEIAMTHFHLGNAYMQMRRPNEAIQSFKEALRLNPKMDGAYNNLGNAYMNSGRLDQATEAYKEASRLNPAAWSPYLNLGMVYLRMGRQEEALEPLKQAVQLGPNNPQAVFMLGETQYRLGQYKEAVESLEKLGQIAPLQPVALQHRSLSNLYIAHGEAAAADANMHLRMTGWREEHSQFMALVAHFGYRQAKLDQKARAILDQAKLECDQTAWPYPIIRYLLREISAQEVFTLANNNDKMTEARAYIGIDLSLSGKKDEALTHLRWVKEYGNGQFVEYPLAITEIARIEARSAPPTNK